MGHHMIVRFGERVVDRYARQNERDKFHAEMMASYLASARARVASAKAARRELPLRQRLTETLLDWRVVVAKLRQNGYGQMSDRMILSDPAWIALRVGSRIFK